MTEPLKATLVCGGVARSSTTAAFFSPVLSRACSVAVSYRSSHSANTAAPSSAADRRETKEARVRIADMSSGVAGTGHGWADVKASRAFSREVEVSLRRALYVSLEA